ncbi:hypothetical protein BAUCODRAFT_472268 [Baudoinia panamericana UAMH 10762]|uniref:BTB domain-containing protein n=1 Tax=Baudoinia panamericana (strain UAMH 10762) TaxID=717646 RepID=M2NB16_BAUPA|nr:uncharacterized protein BAUCODRAFT_472268 [Baudoinia panamericana UAMH 10762]EMC96344.1 hypothetical protein BAUCODRAFT_472268 [Baudoinia panamericana UAMH 10762]
MAKTLDERSLFNNPAYSDITIKFGSRERKCHKLILCLKSTYFDELCGRGKAFAEAQTGTSAIELHDDDEDAVDAMLRWLYTSKYDVASSETAQVSPMFHLALYTVADKYLLDDLRDEAYDPVCGALDNISVAELANYIEHIFGPSGTYPCRITNKFAELRDKHAGALLESPQGRKHIEADGPLCMALIDKYRMAAKHAEEEVAAIRAVAVPRYEKRVLAICPI